MSLQFLKDALEDIKALIAITEQDIADLEKYKGIVPVYENGKIIDFIAKENS